ncbi:hypothetical protein Chor_001951 [Crotalus horridus]
MDQYHLNDDSSLHSEIQLPEFSGNQTLDCSDTFSHDLCPDMRDMIYAGLNNLDVDPSLSTTNINSDSLEDNLDTLSLYSVRDCDSAKLLDDCDTDSQPLLQAPKEMEPGGRSGAGSGKKGRPQQNALQTAFLDCSLCGKVFSSTSSLSKHYVTHSQERKHVCKICGKAFKRQDHLSGHMLTHQKTKPFICIEQGCNKSYSDHRSLRRHYEMHHGLRLLKDEEACESTPPSHDSLTQMGQTGLRAAESLAAHPDSPGPNNSILPNRDLLRCIVSSLVGPKLPSTPSSSVGQSEADPRGPLQPCSSVYGQISCLPTSATAARETPGEKAMKEIYPCQKNVPSSSMYTIINTGNLSILGPSESRTNFPDRPPHSERELPLESSALEYWSNSGVPRFPLLRGQKVPTTTQQPSGSVQWARNAPPVGTKTKGHGLYVAQHEASQGMVGPPHAFDFARLSFECPDAIPFPPAPLKTQEEASGEAKLRCFEETFSPAGRLSDVPKHSLLQKGEAAPLFRPLFAKPQESCLNQDQVQVQSHLFQRITKSQHIVSHTKVLAPSKLAAAGVEPGGAKSAAHGFQQPKDLGRPVAQPMGNDGPPSTPFQADFPSDLEKLPPPSFPSSAAPSGTTSGISHAKHPRPLKRCLECKDFPSPSQSASYENTPGNHTYGKPRQLEKDSPLPRKKEKTKACPKELGSKGHSRSGRPRRKEKPKFDIASMASPSQVAMASFSLPSTSFDSGKTEADLGDRNEKGNSFRCATCNQLFYTERGLNSHMCFYGEQWQSPSGKEKQQAYEAEQFQLQKWPFLAATDRAVPPEMNRSSEEGAVAPIVMPVSVPIMAAHQQQVGGGLKNTQEGLLDLLVLGSIPAFAPNIRRRVDCIVNEKESQDDKDLQEGMPPKKKKKRAHPKSLLIPPPSPAGSEIQSGPGGCYQSNLRSPVFLMDHFLQGLMQFSPYTPPPMLSPIREGSGLYFNTLCSASTNPTPASMYASVLGSHLWTPAEKQLFKKAFALHKKDFYLIQKKIQTKTVSQCVEYYYSWKKILKFDCNRAPVGEKRARTEQDELELDEEKIVCSPKKRHCHLPEQENKLKSRTYKKAAHGAFSPTSSQKDVPDTPRSAGSQGVFPCKECARVFDKIKSRNAHMKRHRLQEQMEPMIKIKWPIKHLKNEPKKEEKTLSMDFLPW